MTEYVVIVDRSAGNESVGEMWKETRVFQPDATIQEVMEWAETRATKHAMDLECSRSNITITRAWQESQND